MKDNELLGKGMTAEIYAWDRDKVLKLFYEWFPVSAAEYEGRIGRVLNGLDVSAPYMYDLIDVDGRKGIIYERIHGKSMLRQMMANPLQMVHYARAMARLHCQIHQKTTDKLPSQQARFQHAIRDSRELLGDRFAAIDRELEGIENGGSLCHGDFHPDNILIADRHYIPIDWMNAYAGHPLGDVARTYLMLSSPLIPPGMPRALIKLSGMMKKIICKAYIEEYFKISHREFAEVVKWFPLVAAARLRERIPGEEQWLLAMVNNPSRDAE